MFRSIVRTALFAGAAAVFSAAPAMAQVGEPTGSFHLKVTHGATTVVNTNVIVPADLSITDGDPEDYVQVGTVGGDPIILKMVSEGGPDFRIVHWYLDVPDSLANIYLSGGTSLFDPLNPASIDVEVTGLAFTGTTGVTPLIVNNSTYLAAFMRDTYGGTGGRFYNLPQGTYFGPGVFSPEPQVQVAGQYFLDGNTALYNFTTSSFLSPTASWKWGALPNPGALGLTTVSSGNNNTPSDGGKVFELGLSVAFVGVPEPATLGLLAPGMLFALRRTRRR